MSVDTNQKLLADYNDVFADIVNVLLFDGEDEIKEEPQWCLTPLPIITAHKEKKAE